MLTLWWVPFYDKEPTYNMHQCQPPPLRICINVNAEHNVANFKVVDCSLEPISNKNFPALEPGWLYFCEMPWFIASLNLFSWLASVFSVGLALLFSIVRRFLDFVIHDRAFLRSLKAGNQFHYFDRNFGLCAKSMSQWRNLHRGSFWIQMQMSTRIHWWSLWHRLDKQCFILIW